jgi:hypothetical protein
MQNKAMTAFALENRSAINIDKNSAALDPQRSSEHQVSAEHDCEAKL